MHVLEIIFATLSASWGCPLSTNSLPSHVSQDARLTQSTAIVVQKSKRSLGLYSGGKLVQCHSIALGFAPVGHKQKRGDGKTPEGWYRTSDKPWSQFKGAIQVHYPNSADARAGLERGMVNRAQTRQIVRKTKTKDVPPQNTKLGGQILIHGGGVGEDWTLGCIALRDDALQELRAALNKRTTTTLLVLR